PLLIKNTARTVDHILALHDSLPISGRARAPPALRFPNSPNRTKLPSFPTRRSSELWPGTSAASATASQQSKAHEAPDPNPSRPVDAARTRNIAEDEPQPAPLPGSAMFRVLAASTDRKSTRLNSSHVAISYAVFCLKK